MVGHPHLDALAITAAGTGSQTSAKSHFWPRSGEAFRKAATAAQTSDQIRSHYISSSHTRLIRCCSPQQWEIHLIQTHVDKVCNPN